MGFIYAPLVHPAMFHASKTRKELGFKTVFNILGPIVNPALPKYRVMGVYDKGYTQKVAKVLKKLAVVRALVFTGSDGMDEISIFSSTHVTELINGRLINYIFEPGKYGFRYSSGCGLKDLQGGSAGENAKIISDILQGKEKGIKKDIAVINAAAVIYVSEKTPDFGQSVEMAEESVENGKAAGILNKMILLSNKKI
jgi:anthranilate phosphoribosyltransferase